MTLPEYGPQELKQAITRSKVNMSRPKSLSRSGYRRVAVGQRSSVWLEDVEHQSP